MKSALFVDFDNVYSGLRRVDQASADRFALQPTVWMEWLTRSLELPDHSPEGSRRRVLVRRCYLNPQAYQRFRPSFNLAGFEIVDCPALTSEGKTSTDIHMVLDIVDLLEHEARYDEFIVFSADADFTPVLRRLRRWDRRTTVLAIGFPSAAYRASADLLIDQDVFVRKALGLEEDSDSPSTDAANPSREISDRVVALIRQILAESSAPVPLAKVASLVLSRVEGLDAATWGGHGSFRGLLDSLSLSPLVIAWDGGGTIHDPKRHTVVPSSATPTSPAKAALLPDSVAEFIRTEVARSPQAVPCARLATMIIQAFDSLAADWNGKGTFRKFAESLDLNPLAFDWNGSGGRIYDPSRHSAPASDTQQAADGSWPDKDTFAIARQIHEVTGVPLLSPVKYRSLFEVVSKDVASNAFNLAETSKRVRDATKETGEPVSRADANYILRGILMRGHSFDEGPNEPGVLAKKHADNVRSLCLREQILLDSATDGAILRWIAGES